MLLDNGLAVLSISAPVMGRVETVHPVLLRDEGTAVLIDAGYPGQLDQLKSEIERCGVPLARIRHVLITHQDIDHIGGLPALIAACQDAGPIEIAAHALEKPYIEGERRLLRFTDEAIASVDRMPSSVPESFKQGLKAIMLNPPSAPVARTVAGGDKLPWCGGIAVVDTPGHTPGHISLYHEPSRTLIAGDALTVRDGELCGPDPETTLDRKLAAESLRQLSAYPIDAVVCYHGGLYKGDANRRIAELAK
ncbi:MBL fold metallo-hydrolase [Paenibacillus thailandensis]|uniref:MBL fold metallo-hydrolase n=1 Tax=Paenibacillus thailandensis TaxID=393250 RepID=A0ABW5R0F9_9BACL